MITEDFLTAPGFKPVCTWPIGIIDNIAGSAAYSHPIVLAFVSFLSGPPRYGRMDGPETLLRSTAHFTLTGYDHIIDEPPRTGPTPTGIYSVSHSEYYAEPSQAIQSMRFRLKRLLQALKDF